MVDWPETIEFCPVVSSYSEEDADAVQRTEMDAGVDKTRLRFTAVPSNISFTLKPITRAQYAVFQSWFRSDLKRGAVPFSAKHPITQQIGSFKFRRPAQARLSGHKVVLRFELEMLP